MKNLLILYDLVLLLLMLVNVQKLGDRPLLAHHRVNLIIILLMVHLMVSLVPAGGSPSWDNWGIPWQ